MVRRLMGFAERHSGALGLTLLALVIGLRIAAYWVLGAPPESDGLAYLAMAKAMAAGGWPVDNFGQHAFYSVGYPLLLAPVFALFGASVPVAVGVNILLALWCALLLRAVVRELGLPAWASLLGMALYALWLPGIWNATMLARENLSTPLLLLILLYALKIAHNVRPWRSAWMAGLAYGCALLAGGSALLLIGAPLLALALWSGWSLRAMLTPAALLLMGVLLVLAPWCVATTAMLGQPVLNTNGGFNLYLGNNPAATGSFVSIKDTPAGDVWENMRADMGEVEASATLGRAARHYMRDNPVRTAELAAVKLARFWQPNVPDAADFAQSKLVSTIRWGEVMQFGLILLLGLCGLLWGGSARGDRWLLAATVGGYWAIHAAAYIIMRYRDPVMPVLIIALVLLLAGRWSHQPRWSARTQG